MNFDFNVTLDPFWVLILLLVISCITLAWLFRKTKEHFMLNGQVIVYHEGEGDVILDLGSIGSGGGNFTTTPSPTPLKRYTTSRPPQTTTLPPPPITTTLPPSSSSSSVVIPSVTPSRTTTITPKLMPQLTPTYLYSAKNKNVYMGDNEIIIRGINWSGLNYGTGIDSLNTGTISDHISILKDQKINAVRLPMSANLMLNMDDMVLDNVSETINPGLKGTNTGVHVNKLIRSLANAGILVMINMHRFTGKGDNEEDIGPLWYSQEYPEDKVTAAWVKVAERFKDFPNVFAMDIKNEPHATAGVEAKWGGSDPKQDWAAACERIGNAILKVNPNVLICVEGVTDQMWGDNVAGAVNRPIELSHPNKVIYSPHFYKHWNYPNKQGFDMNTYMDRVVGALADTNNATIVVGEYSFDHTKQDQVQWVKDLAAYLNRKRIVNAFYWALNENEGVGAGLLARSTTDVIETKIDVMKLITPQPTTLVFPDI
jgi:aryl-phospho-beta-D-glucosidase BglC (GH1 family)